MKALGKAYADTEAMTGEGFEKLPAGGYVVRITEVEDVKDREYLSCVFDIAEGDRKGFYSDQWGKDHPLAHRFVMSYKGTALGMFKGRLRAIDESNRTNFEEAAAAGLNEAALVGRIVGVTIGYEEYVSDCGEIRERAAVRQVLAAQKIREGSFKIPEVKRLAADAAPAAPAVVAPEGFSWDTNKTPF